MNNTTGKLIVFDGNDGSGKQTQAAKLIERLENDGKKVRTIDFPRYYDNFFGAMIGKGLTGDYGDWFRLDPHIASVMYAADRWESTPQIKEWIDKGYIIVMDRYVSANQIHQGGKITDIKKRHEFVGWLDKMEYEVFGSVRPDMIVYLDVPPEISLEVLKKKKAKYADGKQDQHEGNLEFLMNSRACARWMADQSNSWHMVECAADDDFRSVEDIHGDVYEIVNKAL